MLDSVEVLNNTGNIVTGAIDYFNLGEYFYDSHKLCYTSNNAQVTFGSEIDKKRKIFAVIKNDYSSPKSFQQSSKIRLSF